MLWYAGSYVRARYLNTAQDATVGCYGRQAPTKGKILEYGLGSYGGQAPTVGRAHLNTAKDTTVGC